MTLKLAAKLQLPNDAVTQTFLILGKRGSGKTNTAVVLVEEMVRLAPVVVLDPLDAWWGLKSSFAGDEDGLKVYIFGGQHGDLPLDPDSGELMARLFIEHRISMVLSMSGWSVGQRARFVTAFVTYLLAHNDRVPVHVVLEEADAFIPQRPQQGEEAMLGATDRLIRWGRMAGIGATAISQRSAAINKNTTTQAETLIAHRTIGPQDRDAIEEWIKFHGTKEDRDAVLRELPHLKNGEAFVWSPEWLHMLERVFIRRRHTFDSAATPKVGEKQIVPKHLTAVDLEKLRGQLTTVIDKAKQDDPKELRKQLIAAQVDARLLRAEIEKLKAHPAVEVKVEREAIDWDKLIKLWRDLMTNPQMQRSVTIIEAPASLERSSPRAGREPAAPNTAQPGLQMVPEDGLNPQRAMMARVNKRIEREFLVGLTRPQQAILDALAWMENVGQRGSMWTIIAMLAGQSPKSSGFANNVSVLRASGLAQGNRKGGLILTDAGRRVAEAPGAPLTTYELHRAITEKLSAPQGRILTYLVSSGSPTAAPWDTVAKHSGQSPTSSGFANNVSVLRSMGLVRGNRGLGLEATEVLFI